MIPATLIGDLVARRDGDTVTVVEAPRYVLVAPNLIPPPDGWAMRMDGDCLVVAEQVWYLPLEFGSTGAVVCELVRDDRT